MKRFNLFHAVTLVVASIFATSAMAIEPVHARQEPVGDVAVKAGPGKSAVHVNPLGQVTRLISDSGRVVEFVYAAPTDTNPVTSFFHDVAPTTKSAAEQVTLGEDFQSAIDEMLSMRQAVNTIKGGAVRELVSPRLLSSFTNATSAEDPNQDARAECVDYCITAALLERAACEVLLIPQLVSACNRSVSYSKLACFKGCRINFPKP